LSRLIALFDEAPLIIRLPKPSILPKPSRADGFVHVEEVAVEFTTKSLTNEHLRVSTQNFALHGFTPLEGAALEVVAEIGRDRAVGVGGQEVAHDGESVDAPGVFEEFHIGQLFPLEEVILAIRELIHGLVRDMAEGSLAEVMAASIGEVVGVG
jgi:hypothetical protein